MLCQVLAVLGLQKLPMHYAPCSHTEKHWVRAAFCLQHDDDDDVCRVAHLDCSVNHVASQGCSHGSSVGVHSTDKTSATLPVR